MGKKTTALAAYTADLAATDLVQAVDDPSGTPVSKKADAKYIRGMDVLILDVSRDETTDLSTGDGKFKFRMPFAFTLATSPLGVKASVTLAPTGAGITIDIEEDGTTILSTLLTIDATEKTSDTAATPAVISDTALADDAEISINIDQVGSTLPGDGLKVYLRGWRD